jgi:Co/Zn/Cd efflux system component
MQVTVTSRRIQLGIEVVAAAINVVLAVMFYFATESYRDLGIARNSLGALAEDAFVCGLIAIIVAISFRWKIKDGVVSCLLVIVITLWDQACLLSYLIAMIPFRLH